MSRIKLSQASASADTASATGLRRIQEDLSGRGFSVATSPSALLARMSLSVGAIKQVNQAAIELALADGKLNAEQLLKMQTVRSELFLSGDEAAVQAEANVVKRQVGTLSAIADLIGSVHI
jgi:hypothetical protein